MNQEDKTKMLIYAVAAVMALGIGYWFYSIFGGSQKEEFEPVTSFEVPVGEYKEEYNSMLEAYSDQEGTGQKIVNPNIDFKNPFSTDYTDTIQSISNATRDNKYDSLLIAYNKLKEQQERGKSYQRKPSKPVRRTEPVQQQQVETGNESDKEQEGESGFYSISFDDQSPSDDKDLISAIIPKTQTILNDQLVYIKLMENLNIQSKTIPRNTIISGKANFSGERVLINVNSISYDNSIFYVDYSILDKQDGQAGVFTPGGTSQELRKEAADQAINSPSNRIPVIDEAKRLLQRKLDAPERTLRKGHLIFLKRESENQ